MYKAFSAKYYQENKDQLQKEARERYQNLSKEEKEEKLQYGCERYKNLSEDEKKACWVQKKYYRMRKKCFVIIQKNLLV